MGLGVVLISCSVIAFAGAVLTVVTLDDGAVSSPRARVYEEMPQLPLAQDDELGLSGSTEDSR